MPKEYCFLTEKCSQYQVGKIGSSCLLGQPIRIVHHETLLESRFKDNSSVPMAGPGSQQPPKNQIILRIARELIESSVKWFINPLSPESDQHQISPFNVNAL